MPSRTDGGETKRRSAATQRRGRRGGDKVMPEELAGRERLGATAMVEKVVRERWGDGEVDEEEKRKD